MTELAAVVAAAYSAAGARVVVVIILSEIWRGEVVAPNSMLCFITMIAAWIVWPWVLLVYCTEELGPGGEDARAP